MSTEDAATTYPPNLVTKSAESRARVRGAALQAPKHCPPMHPAVCCAKPTYEVFMDRISQLILMLLSGFQSAFNYNEFAFKLLKYKRLRSYISCKKDAKTSFSPAFSAMESV